MAKELAVFEAPKTALMAATAVKLVLDHGPWQWSDNDRAELEEAWHVLTSTKTELCYQLEKTKEEGSE